MVNFYVFFKSIFSLKKVVPIFDLVHDVEAIFPLP